MPFLRLLCCLFIVVPVLSSAQDCVPSQTRMCLLGDRVAVSLTWTDLNTGVVRAGEVVELLDGTGVFWFFTEDEPEVLVRILDGTPVNNRIWVFAAFLNTLEMALVAEDTLTGELRTYTIPGGELPATLTDTNAFVAAAPLTVGSRLDPLTVQGAGACIPDAQTACLIGGRYQVKVDWATNDTSGQGNAQPYSDVATLFSFFSATSLELVVKLLDVGPPGGGVDIVVAPLTNIEFSVTVTDTQTGQSTSIFQPLSAAQVFTQIAANQFEVVLADGFEAGATGAVRLAR